MKQFVLFPILLSLLFLSTNACQSTNETEAVDQDGKEMTADNDAASAVLVAFEQEQESFHDVMAATFHPAEEGDLAPLKEKAADLVAAAEKWAATEIPAKFADKNLKAHFDDLVAGAQDLKKMVADGASDEELTSSITALHDVFHGIMGACKDEEKHEKEHHGGDEHPTEHPKGGEH